MKISILNKFAVGLIVLAAQTWAYGQANLPDNFTVTLPTIPDRSFKITDYGAIADGQTLNTAAIQKTIAACTAAGGGTVVVPAGRYLTAAFTLDSNLNFHLDDGATIVMSDKPSDYKIVHGGFENCISAKDCHDLAITGPGTIDGQGRYFWEHDVAPKNAEGVNAPNNLPERARLVQLSNCVRVLVQNVLLTNSPSFHLVPQACQDVTIDGLRVKAPPSPESHNTDGIDPSGINFLITHCTIDTGDDNIAVKAGGSSDPEHDSCENFLITDCKFLSGHGMSVGSETYGGLRNMLVRNCTFKGTDAGIRFKSARKRGGILENVTFENLTMDDVKNTIEITSYYPKVPKHPEQDPAVAVTERTPVWRNIVIRNVTSTHSDAAGQIIGLPEMPVEKVLFENVRVLAMRPIQIINARDIQFTNCDIVGTSGRPFIANAMVQGLQ